MEEMNLFNDENSKEGVTVLHFLTGEVLLSVKVSEDKKEVHLLSKTNNVYRMNHIQECDEQVLLNEIDGNLNDILGIPLTRAERWCEEDKSEIAKGIWTFFKFETAKGTVTVKWYGSSHNDEFCEVAIDILFPR